MNTAPPTPQKHRQKRDLTVEKLIEATLDVLSEPDAPALTMRRVAERCGVSAMAIYHHVQNKEELETLVVNAVFLKAREDVAPDVSWRAELTGLLLAVRNGLLACPGAGRIFVQRAVVGTGTALTTEEMFRLLHKGGVPDAIIPEAADAITMLLIGSLANELTRPAQIRKELGTHLDPETTPMMQRYLGTYAQRDGEARYLRAVHWLLDGFVGSRA